MKLKSIYILCLLSSYNLILSSSKFGPRQGSNISTMSDMRLNSAVSSDKITHRTVQRQVYPYEPAITLPKTDEEKEVYKQYQKKLDYLKKMKLNDKTIDNLQKKSPTLSFPKKIDLQDVFNIVITSNLTFDEKVDFIDKLYENMDEQDKQKYIDRCLNKNLLVNFRHLKNLFKKEMDEQEKQQAAEELKKFKKAKKEGKKQRKISNPIEDFFDEHVASIPEILNRYYQKEENSFIPDATTISDVLDQIVEKMHDLKYEPYRHMLHNAPQDLHRIISSYYSFSSKPIDKVKEEKYFSEENPIITEDVIRDELNRRLEKHRQEKAQSPETDTQG